MHYKTTIWLDPQTQWEAMASGRRGRQQAFNDATIQTCLTMKVLFGMALQQTTDFAESLLRLIGLDWKVPDSSILCRRQKTLVVDIASGRRSEPLHLLIDSTGFKVDGEDMRASMALPVVASGAKSIWPLINGRWKCAPSTLPATTSVMPPITRANVMTFSPDAVVPTLKNTKPSKPNSAGVTDVWRTT